MAAVLGIVAVIRVLYVLRFDPNFVYAADGLSYISMAENLLSGKGLINSAGPVTILPPIFPIWIALIYSLFSHSLIVLRLGNVFFNLVTAFFVYLTAKKVSKNEWFSYLALATAAVYSAYIFWAGFELTESMFAMACMIVFYYSLVAFEKNTRLKRIVVLGFLIGLTNLIRGGIIFLPFMLAPIFLLKDKLKKGLLTAGVLLITAFIPLCLWGTRNLIKTGEFVPVASHGGFALYLGNNPKSVAKRFHYSSTNDIEKDAVGNAGEYGSTQMSDNLQKRAINYIVQNPIKFLANTTHRFFLYLTPVPISSYFDFFLLKNSLFIDQLITYLSLLGLIIIAFDGLRDKKILIKALIILAIFLSISATYAVTAVVSNARYRLPIMGIEIVVATYGLKRVYDIIKGKVSRKKKNDEK